MTAIIAAIAAAITTAIIANIQGRISERRKMQNQNLNSPQYTKERTRTATRLVKEVARAVYPGNDRQSAQLRRELSRDLRGKVHDHIPDPILPDTIRDLLPEVPVAERQTPPAPPRERGTPGGVGVEPPRNRRKNGNSR